MNEDYKITETNPGGTKTRYAVRKGIGKPVIFTTRRGAEEHVARQTKPVAEDMAAAGPVNVAANVANPNNKPLLKSPLKRFKTFIKK